MVAVMLACWAPQLVPYLVLVGFLAVALWHRAFGECRTCETKRWPKCSCPGGSPDAPTLKKADWRKRD